ncbi:zinc-binding dehydrogenase [Colletotrichum navitas]|uniref:Dehydrogenase FUB6 n=1 Tax=Colletotrichum navitas TaxID=681940 RepID=A0AAD8Q2F8_9PEZI|nr:zinc-binding dehydrogenase [Colletotrichum navitas]KAK1594660.1 zinc-binding dehydrogenase [Colletotrichum navitas]
MTPNKTFVFKKIPAALPVAGEHITVEDRPIDLDNVPEGGIVVEVIYASFDPYQRGRMRNARIKSYQPAFELNGPIFNHTISKVLKSKAPSFCEGDLVLANTPIAEYACLTRLEEVRKVQNPYNLDLALFLGPLGMSGLTAWSGLHKIGQPKKGETIFISSAAGAVGQVVGQIAKRKGLTVIGSVGSDEKLKFIKELGFDTGFNYKKDEPRDALPELAPNGIDIYFDNVGGDHLEAALTCMNFEGRVVSCGMNITMEGFIVFTPKFGPAHFDEHQENMQKWLSDGSVKAKLAVTEDIDNAPDGFIGMFNGKNFGKSILKIK